MNYYSVKEKNFKRRKSSLVVEVKLTLQAPLKVKSVEIVVKLIEPVIHKAFLKKVGWGAFTALGNIYKGRSYAILCTFNHRIVAIKL